MIDSEPRELETIAGVLGIPQNDVIKLVNDVPSILTIERKQVDVSNIEAIGEWSKARDFIEKEEESIENYKLMADASILHYIEGIDIDSVFSKEQYVKIKLWYDEFLPTEEWAGLYHKQYDLAIDFIGKLEEVYGPVAKPKPKSKAPPAARQAETPRPAAEPRRSEIKLKIKKSADEPIAPVESAPEPVEAPEQPIEAEEIVQETIPVESDISQDETEIAAPAKPSEEEDVPVVDEPEAIVSNPVEKKIIVPKSSGGPKKIVFKGKDSGGTGAVKKKIVIKKK